MRPKRTCSIISQRIISNYFNQSNDSGNKKSSISSSNIKRRPQKRNADLSFDESDTSFKINSKENLQPPELKRLRSHDVKNIASNRILQDSNASSFICNDSDITSLKKNHKLLRSNSCISHCASSTPNKNRSIQKKNLKIPIIDQESPPNTRYLLRSNSFRTRPSAPEHLFLTPQAPRRPLSEICKKLTPINNVSLRDLSQISECSNASSSGLSALVLSRFIKKKSKVTNLEAVKKRKYIRIIESSFENADSSSCASIGEDSQSTSIILQDPEKKILDLCNQIDLKSWNCYFDEHSDKPMNKIGEGVYGEVFRFSKGNVLKVFPVDGDVIANGEEQMAMEDVFSEVFVSRKLTDLNDKDKYYRSSNFVQLKKAALLRGKLPSILIDQWQQFKNEKGTDNECLDFLPENQKWMALEYEFAGEPLSSYKFNCYSKIRGIVEQISLSLAVAESAVQFEHRDLHWQNILIKPTKQSKCRYRINGDTYFGSCNGIFATIIDFTVARMCVESNTVYMDMADCPEIFEGEGDYQFEIYRMMKNDNKNNWRDFHPRSNLYWIHYLVDKLLHETSYPRGDPQSKSIVCELRQLYGRVLTYTSARNFIDNDPYFSGCHGRSGLTCED